jgi:hypothetical protein
VTGSLRDTFLRYPAEVPEFAVIPDAALDVLLDFWWDQDELHRAARRLPVEQIHVPSWTWVLRIPFGRTKAGPYTCTMQQVLMAPHLFPNGMERVHQADPGCPIVLCETTGGRMVVMDGIHRIARATGESRDVIPAVTFPRSAVDGILRRDGFHGELNGLRDTVPDIVRRARHVARALVAEAGLPAGWPRPLC